MSDTFVIETNGLKKTFVTKAKGGKRKVEAVKGVDLAIKRGEIFGFLGPNGAGKSTTQKMLSTLIKPTGGSAMINGFDLLKQHRSIRMSIGFVSQAGGTDTLSTGFENLVLQARLYGIEAGEAKKRAEDYIKRFQMESFADRRASSYSGGQRRWLDIALGMIHRPMLLLLDEPTTGLDPQSRAYLWEEIRRLKADGVTVFLTTHYLDEADKLCDTVAIIDGGLIAAMGKPDELKAEIGADAVAFGFDSELTARKAAGVLKKDVNLSDVQCKANNVRLYVHGMEDALPGLLRALDLCDLPAQAISLSKPSLDDVFLKHTGRSLRGNAENENNA